MYSTITQIQLSPEQLSELIRGSVRAELANYIAPAPSGPDLPEFLTRKEAAKVLRISLVTLWEWTKGNEDRPSVIQHINVNGRIRYRRDDILALLGKDNGPRHIRRQAA